MKKTKLKKTKLIPIMLTVILMLQILLPIVPNVSVAATYDGWDYEEKEDGTIEITGFHRTVIYGNVEIPSSIDGKNVTSIGTYAFSQGQELTGITIPDTVRNIGSGAFNWCTNLTSITIPNGVTRIWDETFNGCTGLTSITIPNSVTIIDVRAFYDCKSLTNITIPNSVTIIGDRAFRNCTGLTNITIPDSVIRIGKAAFKGCSGLTNITIPESVADIGGESFIGDEVFSECDNVTITCTLANPDSSNFTYKTTASTYAEENNIPYKIIIPDGCTYIVPHAFSGCSGLTNITIPNSVTAIGFGAFGGCSGLTSITVPSSVDVIGHDAFGNCTGLTDVTIQDGVECIGDSAFKGCTNLTSVTIPDSVTEIYDNSFNGCDNLTKIICSPNSEAYKYAKANDIEVESIDTTAPTIQIQYNKHEEDNSTTVEITANEQIQPIEGWTLSEDKCTLSKNYTIGKIEEITIQDLAGNQTTAKIEVIKIRANFTSTENSITTTIDIGEISKELLTYQIYVKKEAENEYILKYEGKETEKTIQGLEPNTTYTIRLIATYNNSNVTTEQTIKTSAKTNTDVVTGDVDGDGKITLIDLTKIKKHIAEITLLEGEYKKAADINKDGEINITDMVQIKKAIAELIQL